jgi:hypothetical protein
MLMVRVAWEVAENFLKGDAPVKSRCEVFEGVQFSSVHRRQLSTDKVSQWASSKLGLSSLQYRGHQEKSWEMILSISG